MTELLTAAQMRAIEQAAIESGEVTGLELMERAGRGVVEAIFEEWPELSKEPHQAVVLCGPGNNGGDGFVVARLLKDLGWSVRVFSTGPSDPLPSDAASNRMRWRETDGGSRVYGLDDLEAMGGTPTLFIDAIFGIGQNRSADAIMSVVDRWRDALPELRAVSVDIPTGYDADTGRCLGSFPFEADLTVSFHRFKPVHKTLQDQGYRCVLKDIGL